MTKLDDFKIRQATLAVRVAGSNILQAIAQLKNNNLYKVVVYQLEAIYKRLMDAGK